MRFACVLPALLLLGACATTGQGGSACPAGLQSRQTAELYFGRNIGADLGVSEGDWRRFLDEEVTPRFPDGLTVLDAAGQWRGEGGTVVHEPSKALMLVLSGASDEPARLDAVRAAYKTRFRQEAVMLVRRQACVGF
ncbi:DUF3574 domain-containing protein [Caulobacter mirabilis]|uniref:DUF3574 domain-containing protein n=1 Tax=Caulobacter mirabilis TaxID=69666 RepID=A0A2D2AX82_9CAUL|nr:DUF3574 domain-containing protein [Caulobacter mirabilis]ATQ42619.1 hypothetical protein CSW64_09470 [Caulobacter mirabilis]